jgi:hypothetical protein
VNNFHGLLRFFAGFYLHILFISLEGTENLIRRGEGRAARRFSVKEPKVTGGRSARQHTRGKNPLVLHICKRGEIFTALVHSRFALTLF